MTLNLENIQALNSAVTGLNETVLPSYLDAITKVIPSKICSLWQINESIGMTTLLARTRLPEGTGMKADDYRHPIEGSFIGRSIEQHKEEKRPFYQFEDISQGDDFKIHRSQDLISICQLKALYLIPIPIYQPGVKAADRPLDAILKIYPQGNPQLPLELLELIQDQLSFSLYRHRLVQKEELTGEIIKVYKEIEDLSEVLGRTIDRLLRKYLRFEGCSVFILDQFLNRLNLSHTTGLKDGATGRTITDPANVYYHFDEGLTGNIARIKKSKCLKDVNHIEDPELFEKYKHKYIETTRHEGQSFMGIPIMSPSRKDELVGVIRFTNKLGPLSNDFIDYFNDHDRDLVEHACNLIALYMEYEQSERARAAFARQIAHEVAGPATSIRAHAEGLKNHHSGKIFFPDYKYKDYLTSIYDQADLQIAFTESIIYHWGGKNPCSSRYEVAKKDFADIIEGSKKMVIPFAREQKLTFDNIKIKGVFPELFVDDNAFKQAFFNLFTNAIKYRQRDPEKFSVEVTGFGAGRHEIQDPLWPEGQRRAKSWLIKVRDNGIGINQEDVERIFLLGYRAKGHEESQIRGLGMGLAVVLGIISDFGGHILVDRLKNPTSFSIFLPDSLVSDAYTKTVSWRSTSKRSKQ